MTKESERSTVRPLSPLKRKPEDTQIGPPKKLVKPDGEQSASGSNNRPSSSSGLAPKLAATSLSKAGTANGAKGAQTTTDAPSSSKYTAHDASSANPAGGKKKSYKDMMARARAAQATQPQTPPSGQIRHSTAVSKKKVERREAREQARQATKSGKELKFAPEVSKSGSSTTKTSPSGKNAKNNPVEAAVKKKKERPPLEYKGTMRGSAATSATKAPLNKPSVAPMKRKEPPKYNSESDSDVEVPELGKRYTYADSSDEEEDEGYDSEASSEMEGAGFDALEAEEQASLRAARKEDAQALEEEESHRLEKLARKKKLQQLASKAHKPRF